MYSIFELKELKQKPRINDISLAVLQEYYEEFLHPFIYEYTITYASGDKKKFELRFDKENFCHLLGIESIARNAISNTKIYNYKGMQGWENIKNNKISIPELKKLDKRKFRSVKAKYVYFFLLPKLVSDPVAINYNKGIVRPPTNIECEIMFYSSYENAIIHLGIENPKDKTYYIARTFFVEKLSKDNPVDIYIKNQEQLSINMDLK